MIDPRKQALRDLQRLGQEWDYCQHGVPNYRHCQACDDDFTISMRMWAVMICGGIACWAVIGALFANWMEWI